MFRKLSSLSKWLLILIRTLLNLVQSTRNGQLVAVDILIIVWGLLKQPQLCHVCA
jgi:hypothetical protein